MCIHSSDSATVNTFPYNFEYEYAFLWAVNEYKVLE